MGQNSSEAPIEALTRAVQGQYHLLARSLIQDFHRVGINLAASLAPADPSLLVLAAALTDLFATRQGLPPPAWTVGARFEVPFYLDSESAKRSPKMRARLEREAPEALRRHNVWGGDQTCLRSL
jgi:hypothetical protein